MCQGLQREEFLGTTGDGCTGNAELRSGTHPVGQGSADPARCLFWCTGFSGNTATPISPTLPKATLTRQQQR